MILSRILCPVDFSPYSDRAVDLLVSTPGVGEVILLTVVSRGETNEEIKVALHEAESRLAAIGRDLAGHGIKVRVLAGTGNPGSEITRIAEREAVSVIWMSSRGRGWFSDLLLGSTAYDVAVNSTKPVIIIRKPGKSRTDPGPDEGMVSRRDIP